MLYLLLGIIAIACLPMALVVVSVALPYILVVVGAILAVLLCIGFLAGGGYMIANVDLTGFLTFLVILFMMAALIGFLALFAVVGCWLRRICLGLLVVVLCWLNDNIDYLDAHYTYVAPMPDWMAALCGLAIGLVLTAIFWKRSPTDYSFTQ